MWQCSVRDTDCYQAADRVTTINSAGNDREILHTISSIRTSILPGSELWWQPLVHHQDLPVVQDHVAPNRAPNSFHRQVFIAKLLILRVANSPQPMMKAISLFILPCRRYSQYGWSHSTSLQSDSPRSSTLPRIQESRSRQWWTGIILSTTSPSKKIFTRCQSGSSFWFPMLGISLFLLFNHLRLSSVCLVLSSCILSCGWRRDVLFLTRYCVRETLCTILRGRYQRLRKNEVKLSRLARFHQYWASIYVPNAPWLGSILVLSRKLEAINEEDIDIKTKVQSFISALYSNVNTFWDKHKEKRVVICIMMEHLPG